jgi:hypothetical protein
VSIAAEDGDKIRNPQQNGTTASTSLFLPAFTKRLVAIREAGFRGELDLGTRVSFLSEGNPSQPI